VITVMTSPPSASKSAMGSSRRLSREPGQGAWAPPRQHAGNSRWPCLNSHANGHDNGRQHASGLPRCSWPERDLAQHSAISPNTARDARGQSAISPNTARYRPTQRAMLVARARSRPTQRDIAQHSARCSWPERDLAQHSAISPNTARDARGQSAISPNTARPRPELARSPSGSTQASDVCVCMYNN
jgi:hypothetical protein